MTKIKRINSINNLGVYKNFTRSGNIPDFNDKNIIYGWNYCGKTTLSRLFNWLNPTCSIDDDFANCTFEIELENGERIRQDNRDNFKGIVQVFNTDFIDANLQFNTKNGISNKINAITFDLGEESKPFRDKIAILQQRLNNYDLIIQATSVYTTRYNNFESLFTTKAREIKNDFFYSSIEFTKAHLKRIIEEMSPNTYHEYIITDISELAKSQSDALEKDAKPVIDATYPKLIFDEIFKEVQDLLASSPQNTITDEILSKDHDLYEWSKHGLELHTHGKTLKTCAFCGQELSPKRLNFLNSFYSNEAAKVKEKAKSIIQRIENEKRLTQFSAWLTLSEFSFTGDFGSQYQRIKEEYTGLAENYLSLLDILTKVVQDKIENSLFISVTLPKFDTASKNFLENWINRMGNIIKGHNESVGNFVQIKNQAIKKYKYHLVATFLEDINYYEVLAKQQRENQLHDALQMIKASLYSKIQTLEARVKSIAKGKEVCNKYIQLFLHRDDIKIEITDDNYFILKRSSKLAKNLSEGEKTVIALAYFLVLLDSDLDKLMKSIIVIDDPISSLDANHIAQVSSQINSFFFRKNIDKTQPEKVVDCFSQLFILTHNFEFYTFIHDANNIKRKKSDTLSGSKVSALNEYLIKRVNKEESTIINMPKSLGTYKSEYVYLWQQIIEYRTKGYPEEMLYYMPNVARRFLEIYTLIKLPGNHDEIDNRIKILVSDVNELKILHNYSHFTSIERVIKHSELILKMPEIIDDIFTLVQKDKMHFNSLTEAIKNG